MKQSFFRFFALNFAAPVTDIHEHDDDDDFDEFDDDADDADDDVDDKERAAAKRAANSAANSATTVTKVRRRRRRGARDKAAAVTGQTATLQQSGSSSSSHRHHHSSSRSTAVNAAAPAAAAPAPASAAAAPESARLYSHTAIPHLESFDAGMQARFEQLELAAGGFSDQGWHFVCEMSGVTVTRTDQASESGHTCTKGVVHIRDRATRIYELVADVPMFVQWVDRIVRAECVRRINAYSGFNCVEFAAVWPVSGREVLFVQTAARKPDGTILVLWWPDETAEARIKPRKGVVRASVGPSGFVIQPLDESVTGPDRQVCLTTCVLQFDMKAWIPASWTDGIATVQHFLLASVIDALAKDSSGGGANGGGGGGGGGDRDVAGVDHSALRESLIQRRDALVKHLESIDSLNAGKAKSEDQLSSIMAIAGELADVAERLKQLE